MLLASFLAVSPTLVYTFSIRVLLRNIAVFIYVLWGAHPTAVLSIFLC